MTPWLALVVQLGADARWTDATLAVATVIIALGTLGTMIGTLATAGFAVWSARQSLALARQEREARVAAEDEAFTRVVAWARVRGSMQEHGINAVILNSTALPIYQVGWALFVHDKGSWRGVLSSSFDVIAPGEAVRLPGRPDDLSNLADINVANPAFAVNVVFTDVRGRAWQRHPNGQLAPVPKDPRKRVLFFFTQP